MDYSPALEAIITHAVSQLTYRWIPLDALREDQQPRIDPMTFKIRDWHRYILMRQSEEPLAADGWLARMEAARLSPVGLATVIFDNLMEITHHQGNMVDYFHPYYPEALKHIPDPPACLTCIGDVTLLHRTKYGLVGSRKASNFAYDEARALARGLAARGIVVVSGGAVGCDAAAHLGALESEILPAPTIVVFAGGLKTYHPRMLSRLFERLAAREALFISERLWEYPARPQDFPVRNRLISGLSSHLFLMQAHEKSGALHTANFALDQGREVYVLDHGPDDCRADGSQRLIEEGAFSFTSAKSYLETIS